MRGSCSLERCPSARRDELVGDAFSVDGERLLLDAEELGRDDAEGACRHGVHLVPGFVFPELEGGIAERTGVEVCGVADWPDLHGLVSRRRHPRQLDVFSEGLELDEPARRYEAVQPRRQVAGVRAERRYVDGRDRRGYGGVAFPAMLVRRLVPRHF